MKQSSRENLVIAAALCGFAVYLVLGCMHHEAWRDEWQAINIGRAATSLPDLYERLRYEGHPALWYLVIRAAWEIYPSLFSVQIINVFFALAAAGLVAFLAPWPLWLRLMVAFAGPTAWEYSVKARSYGLGWLIIVALACVLRGRESRWKGWFVVLLAILALNTSLFTGVLALSLVAGWLWDEFRASRLRQTIPPIALLSAAALGTLLLILPPQDVVTQEKVPISDLTSLLQLFSSSLLPNTTLNDLPLPVVLIIIGLVVVISFSALCASEGAIIALAFGWISIMVLFITVIRGYPWHHWHLFLTPIAVAIAYERRKSIPKTAIMVLVILATLGLNRGLRDYVQDWKKTYSAAKPLAQAIKSSDLARVPIIVSPDYYIPSLSGYLDRPLNDGLCKGESTYVVWRKPIEYNWLNCATQLAATNPSHICLITFQEPLKQDFIDGLRDMPTVKLSLFGIYLAAEGTTLQQTSNENFYVYVLKHTQK